MSCSTTSSPFAPNTLQSPRVSSRAQQSSHSTLGTAGSPPAWPSGRAAPRGPPWSVTWFLEKRGKVELEVATRGCNFQVFFIQTAVTVAAKGERLNRTAGAESEEERREEQAETTGYYSPTGWAGTEQA
ncbi:hypothetical protein GQ600_6910 [Phytophthora cactorum]|nr:hypothetical protein GQ600_6910 [Phytophthora cactorum]